MKNIIKISILTIITLFSCERQNIEPENTIFFFFPWSTNLTNYFEDNIINFENALSRKEVKHNKIVVFISQTKSSACIYEIKIEKGRFLHDTIAKYDNYNYEYTNTDGLSKLLTIAKGEKATKQFSMIIGCHGDAWIPSQDMKKSFGGNEIESRINISTLHDALKKTKLTTEYILFDDCYMSSVEVAYELKDVCKHLIASPTEIMAAGMPYQMIAKDLLHTPNYENICKSFYNYYKNHPSTPYGSITIINCQELDNLANIVNRINRTYPFSNNTNQTNIQFFDGYNPHIFYDLGDYISRKCTDNSLLKEFNEQINKTTPYKAHTDYVYSYNFGTIKIEKYSGLSTSEPSTNNKCASYQDTKWWKATNNQ